MTNPIYGTQIFASNSARTPSTFLPSAGIQLDAGEGLERGFDAIARGTEANRDRLFLGAPHTP